MSVPELEYLPADVFELQSIERAALAGRPRPESLPGICIPGDVADVPRVQERLAPDERSALVEALETNLAPFEPHVAVLDSLRALAQPDAAMVVTGQQPGFLGGPLYTLFKALHAVRLARALAESWGTSVVPVFWNHADDHDVAEVHHLHVVNRNLDLRKIGLAGMSSGRRPFADITLSDETHRLASIGELLRQLLPEGPHRETAIELFLPRDGESLSNAFTRGMSRLLGPQGLVVLEPAWIRPQLSRALADIVAADPGPALREGALALAAAGHEASIDPTTAALVFHHVEGKRQALRLGGDGFRYDDEPGSRSPAELAAEIVQSPGPWSAGALLRPIVQDLVLPVAAYVGGFGELRYHAELPPLRRRVEAPESVFVPRVSCTLVDPETQTSLEKLGLSVLDVVKDRGRLGEGEETALPVAERLRRVAAAAARDLEALRNELAELDQGLAVQLKRTASQLADLVDKLARKAERVHANREGKGRRHQRRLQSALYPRGLPQERVLGALSFVARFGTGWIEELALQLDPFPSEHLVVHLRE
ncbi:MAG: bacillithiol biosynthesis cysteine-adding enzyme BshC [Planctomycetota bacterium]|nr:bacillithiol biosynthesis cysteine-adding enzyme BshC [Planctomycetota bacterium]